ncbi:TlpA disulfide reductase family protein [Flavivirga eckloniae]|uniref:TlpA disulfide reductase family protein n=1 Tax=Flavivirga eckloniae TaxID=1803846 RepID=UPI001315A282|nr:TlpA disulfide reductase family protein [Flavivirga eckloniae]
MQFIKHICIFILVFQLIGCKTNNEGTYQISGTINGLDTGTISIVEWTGNGDEFIIDQTTIKDGTFSFSGKMLHSKPVNILINEVYGFSFFLEPEDIMITIDSFPKIEEEFTVLKPIIKGGIENQSYQSFSRTRDSIKALPRFKKIDKLIERYAVALKNNNEQEIYAIEETLNAIETEQYTLLHNTRKTFILNHPKAIAAPYVLLHEGDGMSTEVFTEEELEAMITNFDSSIAYSSDYKECVHNLEVIKKLAIGKTAPDFTLQNQSNIPVSLKDYRGKVVLLDFWTYWCAPCVDEFPYLKELYGNYKNKGFEIISISDDPDIDSWKKALTENNLPWTQCIIASDKETDVSRSYYIEALPTKYLIGKNGEILDKNPDRETLENILKSKLN